MAMKIMGCSGYLNRPGEVRYVKNTEPQFTIVSKDKTQIATIVSLLSMSVKNWVELQGIIGETPNAGHCLADDSK